MRWTSEQLKNHPKRDELMGVKPHPHKKASDEAILAAYQSTWSVWKAAKLLGMCGQTVWERLKRMGCLLYSTDFTPDQEKLILDFYATSFERGGNLKAFCGKHDLLPTSVARWAGKQGLTNPRRKRSDTLNEVMGKRMKTWHKHNPHPKGMLGKKHTPATLELLSEASLRSAANRTVEQEASRMMKAMKTRRANGNLIRPRQVSWRQGWRSIGEQRIFARSSWEANYARYLEWLRATGNIISWEHEPLTFWFEGVRRGVNNYTPDFRVTTAKGVEWIEVKGWMDAKSKTKIRRFKKYFPTEKLIVVRADWFKMANRKLAGLIPGWENSRQRVTLQFPPEPNAPGPSVCSSTEPPAPVASAFAPAMAESLTPPNASTL